MKSLLVYCGSSRESITHYGEVARELGALIASRGCSLVYGGGRTGLMGVVADAVMAGGGRVTGVIPKSMSAREIAHYDITKLHIVETMHERKAMMLSMADAVVALPGGIGTLEEWSEAITWLTLGYHDKPVGLLNAGGFYDPLIAQVDVMQKQGLLHGSSREKILVEREPAAMLDALARLVAR